MPDHATKPRRFRPFFPQKEKCDRRTLESYPGCDRVTQTTSRELTPASVLVASQQRPQPQELMSLRLYLPDAGAPAGLWGKVRETDSAGEFWLDLLEVVSSVSARIAALLSRRGPPVEGHASPHRSTVRYPTSIAASIESGNRRIAAKAINLSSGGAFLRCREGFDVGSSVSMKLLIPDRAEPLAVGARIVHVCARGPRHAPWSEPGLGLQFIDGSDDFRARIDRYLELIGGGRRTD